MKKTTSIANAGKKFIMELILALLTGYRHQMDSQIPWCVALDTITGKVVFKHYFIDPAWHLVLFTGDSVFAQAGCGWTTHEYSKLQAPLIASEALSVINQSGLSSEAADNAVRLLTEVLQDFRKSHSNPRQNYEELHRAEMQQMQNQ